MKVEAEEISGHHNLSIELIFAGLAATEVLITLGKSRA